MKTLTIEDDYTLIDAAHEGISIGYFDKLLQVSGMQKGLLASLVGIDVKTVDNYRKNAKKLMFWKGAILKIRTIIPLWRGGF
ncbi:hypothetical protein Q0590_35895 [Rhodocytophaga aerolata]|uniref:HTH luxR-type domain-containing protein n=1 Tax=Rhodocytophaga aerolata TaxID=455078 RepID=A0ABT8RHY0_9BACT|nr:hypothetical protein [Rhodocytophaga aerolata]MDO1451712.1 hypothetical protein [Rhodocytophaga aerolata]